MILFAHELRFDVPDVDPARSLRRTIVFDSRDWAHDIGDAWIYGIVIGWGDAINEVAAKHGWDLAQRTRLRLLHLNYRRAVVHASREEGINHG